MSRRTRFKSEPAEGGDPVPVGRAAARLIADRGWEDKIALGRLRSRWAEVVGDQIASRSQPVRLEKGRLTIRVEGGAWAAELALLGSSLANASARFLGAGRVREVAVIGGRGGRP